MNASDAPPVWQIWRNPIVRRYATARLRPLPVAGWSLVVQPLAAFLWLAVYFAARNGTRVVYAALLAWIPILILQGVIWLLKGTFSVAAGIAREGAEGLSETQRLTPLGAWHKVFGYLFGLPILETALVASLLPWAVVSAVMAHLPLGVLFRVYLLLATAALLHHSIGLVAGTIIRQKIVAGTVSQLLVILLHSVVPLLARFGLGTLGHLGVERAISAELLAQQGIPDAFSTVRFFDFKLPLTAYSWVVMAILITFLLQILRRRLQRAEAHLFSKPLALAFAGWIIVMSLGETFPLLKDGTLFNWGNRLLEEGGHGKGERVLAREAMSVVAQGVVPVGWAGAFGCVALLSAMILAAIITPTLEQHGRARRARRDDPAWRLSWMADARSALLWTAALGLMVLAGWSLLVGRLLDTPLLHLVLRPGAGLPFVLGAGLLVPLLTWTVLLEWRGLKVACLGAFVCWVIPVMVGVVGMLSGVSFLRWPRWWLGVSGFTMPFYSMSQSMSGLGALADLCQQLRWPWLLSLGVHAVLAVVMFGCLRRAQRLSAG